MDLGALEAQARSVLPAGVYDYIAGGADDEVTLADNVEAWGRMRLRPHVLRDVSAVETATTVLGHAVGTPVGVAPTAFHGMAHPEAECATATGVAAAGALHVLSTRATVTAADCAASAPGAPRWFQVYVLRHRARTEELVLAAKASGCGALVLTGDTPFLGRRRRDLRNRFELPPGAGGPSIVARAGEPEDAVEQSAAVTLDDIAWLRDLAGLPVVVKGVVRGDDARACIDAGAAAIWVSNHGGRQLDGCIATADALRDVVAAVGAGGGGTGGGVAEVYGAEIYVDGGIRRGTDVLKALALGATAAFVGRPVLWGLATDGGDGVRRVLRGLTQDLASAMALCGVTSVAEVTPDLVAG